MRNTSFYEIISILIIIIGIISLSFAYVINNTVIHNTGKIIPENTAKSGYWRDIQDAVDLAASLGVGIVHIPEGTWNFVNINETLTGVRVTIPAGIDIYGAPTERYANGSVIEWKTILVMPWNFTNGDVRTWFKISGSSDPNRPSRFSDIKLVGYRSIDPSFNGTPNSPPNSKVDRGLLVYRVINFRVDHCCFEHMCDKGVVVQGPYCCGVIDHCLFDNPIAHTLMLPDDSNIDYGVTVLRDYALTPWESNLANVAGKYLNYTTFIEDCVFTQWRSSVAGGMGAHYVVRHCIFEHGNARGDVDVHPTFVDYEDSNRCVEAYENIWKDPVTHEGWNGAFELWGGGGLIFNNSVSNDFANFMWIYATGGPPGNPDPKYYPYFFIWDNSLGGSVDFKYSGSDGVEGVNYFQYAPNFTYTPYPYPHPLTLT